MGIPAWGPGDSWLACVHGRELTVRDSTSLDVLRGPVDTGADLQLDSQGEMVAVTGDGRWIVVGTLAGVQLFDAESLQAVGVPFPHERTVRCAAIDECAPALVTADGEWAKVWTLDPADWLTAARRLVDGPRPADGSPGHPFPSRT